MNMVIINLLYIAIIITIITDMSDFPNTIKKVLRLIVSKGENSNTNYRLHLVDCSFCQIFWCCMIYLLIVGELSLFTVAISLLIALLPELISGTINLVKDSVIFIIQKLNSLL